MYIYIYRYLFFLNKFISYTFNYLHNSLSEGRIPFSTIFLYFTLYIYIYICNRQLYTVNVYTPEVFHTPSAATAAAV